MVQTCAGSGVGPRNEPVWAHLACYPQLHEEIAVLNPPFSKAFLPQRALEGAISYGIGVSRKFCIMLVLE